MTSGYDAYSAYYSAYSWGSAYPAYDATHNQPAFEHEGGSSSSMCAQSCEAHAPPLSRCAAGGACAGTDVGAGATPACACGARASGECVCAAQPQPYWRAAPLEHELHQNCTKELPAAAAAADVYSSELATSSSAFEVVCCSACVVCG